MTFKVSAAILSMFSFFAQAEICARLVDVPSIDRDSISVVYEGGQSPVKIASSPQNVALLVTALGRKDFQFCVGDASNGVPDVSSVSTYEADVNAPVPVDPSSFANEICGRVANLVHMASHSEVNRAWVTLTSGGKKAQKQGLFVTNVNLFLPAFAAALGKANAELCFAERPYGVYEFVGARPLDYSYLQ